MEDSFTASSIFDREYYLKFCQEKNREFMSEFTRTQEFTNFIEQADKRKKDDVGFFRHCLKILFSKSFLHLKSEQGQLIDHILKNFKNVILIPNSFIFLALYNLVGGYF